MDSLIMDYSN
jgi:hypothetical protein